MGEFSEVNLPKEIKEESEDEKPLASEMEEGSEDEKPLPTEMTKGEHIRQEILGKITFGKEKIAEVLVPENDWDNYLNFCKNNDNDPDQMGGVPIRSSKEVETLTFIKNADKEDQ